MCYTYIYISISIYDDVEAKNVGGFCAFLSGRRIRNAKQRINRAFLLRPTATVQINDDSAAGPSPFPGGAYALGGSDEKRFKSDVVSSRRVVPGGLYIISAARVRVCVSVA